MTDFEQIDSHAVDLYQLLPAIYRIRDAEQGYPLRAFLDVIGQQVDIFKRDVDQLWDDVFIETCREWVIPYIGDLVGNIPVHEVGQRRRADVARTIFYRRRKGTLSMLEQLARDVTGWSAHTVAFFELLGWTQNMNHLRRRLAPDLHRRVRNASKFVGTAHVRDLNAMDQIDGPFDRSSHTVDVRQISQQEGWYNIRNVGFFLWRLQDYPLLPGTDSDGNPQVGVTPKQAAAPNAHGFHFSPLGNSAALFCDPEREADEFELADEKHVRGPIRPIAFHYNPADYYGPGKSFAIYRGKVASDANLVTLDEVICTQLDDWAKPPPGKVAVDVRLGRFTFAAGEVPDPDHVTVYYNYGFSADIGGGPYVRRLVEPADPSIWAKTVAKSGPSDYTMLADALTDWEDPAKGNKANAAITILDNATYEETITLKPGGSRLVIRADNRHRPHFKGNMTITGSHPEAALSLSGLLIEGQIELNDSLGGLHLDHCTLVPGVSLDESGAPTAPGTASLTAVQTNTSLEVRIDACITGALQLPGEMQNLFVTDSIIDGGRLPAIFDELAGVEASGPRTTLQRVTIWGRVRVKELTLASEVIFNDPVIAHRRQKGCVRFSYLSDEASCTPVRYRCQPELAIEGVTCPQAQARLRARIRPSFTSEEYGQPGYGQLHLSAPQEIRTGAEDGSEMGAFALLKQPQREANLRIRLEEYLPFGLAAGLIYVT